MAGSRSRYTPQRRDLLGAGVEADIVLPGDGAGNRNDDLGQAVTGIPGVGGGGAIISGDGNVVLKDLTPAFDPKGAQRRRSCPE